MQSKSIEQTSDHPPIVSWGWTNFSLHTKLISAFLVLIILSTGTIVLVNNANITDALLAQKGKDLAGVANSRALATGNFLDRQVSLLQLLSINRNLLSSITIANAAYGDQSEDSVQSRLLGLDQRWLEARDDDPWLNSHLTNVLAQELKGFRTTFPDHVEVFVTSNRGALVAATNRTSDFYQADEAWWQAAYDNGQGKIYIDEPEFDTSSGTYAIKIAVPIYSQDSGEVIGILRTAFDVEALTDLLASGQLGETGSIEVYLPGGQDLEVNVGPNGETELAVGSAEFDLVALSQQQPASTGYTETEHQNIPYLISQAPIIATTNQNVISELDWKMVARQSKAEALEIIEQQSRSTSLLAVFIMGIASVIAFALGQQLSAPLTRLARTMTRFTEGDLSARSVIDSKDETGILATNFNQMASQLQETLISLEERVASRTRALEISLDISRRLSTILDEDHLISEVAEQVQNAFDYYNVQIYLVDKRGETLSMANVAGKAARILLSQGQTISKGKGLIGRAAEANVRMLASDVSQESDWLPHPLLPEAKAEVAVPIAVGETVLGVLDVQHNVVGGLTQVEADLLQSIGNQVAVVLQNVRTYARAQQQAEREVLVNTLSQKIQNATSVDQAMQVTVRELGRVLGTGRTQIYLRSALSADDHRVTAAQHNEET